MNCYALPKSGHKSLGRRKGISTIRALEESRAMASFSQTTILLVAFSRQFGAGDGSVQQLHVMHHGQWMSRFIQHGPELQLTSRIAGRHRLSRRRDNPLRLALAQLAGRLLLHQTIETCRAATERGLGKLQ